MLINWGKPHNLHLRIECSLFVKHWISFTQVCFVPSLTLCQDWLKLVQKLRKRKSSFCMKVHKSFRVNLRKVCIYAFIHESFNFTAKFPINALFLASLKFGGVFFWGGVLIFYFFLFSVISRGFDLVVDLYLLIKTFIHAHFAVYLNWRRDSTAKGATKNTSLNAIRLQCVLIPESCFFFKRKWSLFLTFIGRQCRYGVKPKTINHISFQWFFKSKPFHICITVSIFCFKWIKLITFFCFVYKPALW